MPVRAGDGSGGGFGTGGSAGGTMGGTPGTGGLGGFAGFPGGVGAGPSVDPDATCQATPYQAEKRLGGEADIIWALDNSGSMFDEAGAMQNNMNIFSRFIAGTGIDVRVVVISSTAGFPFVPPYGVCIAPPLGSGACPNDSNPPVFLHVLQEVGSHDPLLQIQQTFDQWEGAYAAELHEDVRL